MEQGVGIVKTAESTRLVTHSEMVDDDILGEMKHLVKGMMGSFFEITKAQYERIVELSGSVESQA